MTPTGRPLGHLGHDELAHLNASGEAVSGSAPTKECNLHLAVYASRPAVQAIVHLHSTYAVALSCLADLDPDRPLPPLTPYQVMRLDDLRVVPYAMPGSDELAEAARIRALDSSTLLLANHGSLVGAASLDEAVSVAEELEESARIALALSGRSTRQLDPVEVERIRERFRR
jgi:ribulose-5-phosphate 4-epimerase/fuculose-1-phosphate aldolase